MTVLSIPEKLITYNIYNIYIYREREREGGREIEREREGVREKERVIDSDKRRQTDR